jgi:hypothetical protein
MSLTSYRAAPSRGNLIHVFFVSHQSFGTRLSFILWIEYFLIFARILYAFCRPGSDLLSRALRQSTIGAKAFHGRVRNGNGCSHLAMTTRSAKSNVI